MEGGVACVKNSKMPNGAGEWEAIEERWGSERQDEDRSVRV